MTPARARNSILILGFSAALSAFLATRPAPLPESFGSVSFAVSGMHCRLYCPLRVTASLRGRPGILDLRADLDRGTVRVLYDEALWDEAAIERALRAHLAPPYRLEGRIRALPASFGRPPAVPAGLAVFGG
ncbi:MAG: hypothetical protein Fur0037_23260 [Planctomycetota bacterium]